MGERTSLTGVSISDGYPQLLHVADTTGLTSTPTEVYDANGTATVVWLSTTETRFGSSTAYTEIDSVGDVTFVTGGGLCFAEIFAKDNATTMTLNSSGKVQVTIFDTNGEVNGDIVPDHTNDHITISVAGRYHVLIDLTIENEAAQAHKVNFELFVNNGNTGFDNVHADRSLTGGSSDVASMALTGIVDFAVNDTVEIWANTSASANRAVTVEDITLTLIQIGGAT